MAQQVKRKWRKRRTLRSVYEAFGDEERNDDNLAKFAEQYPEWIAKSDDGDTPPPIGAGLGNASEPSATDPFIQALNS
ncbi:hypothetical protein R4518_00500 [Listeria monocytogenes]|nr:hypothetical protein R4518_00500 [Listeria monocytogenes]